MPIGAPGSIARYLQERAASGEPFAQAFGAFVYGRRGDVVLLQTGNTRDEASRCAIPHPIVIDVRTYGCTVIEPQPQPET